MQRQGEGFHFSDLHFFVADYEEECFIELVVEQNTLEDIGAVVGCGLGVGKFLKLKIGNKSTKDGSQIFLILVCHEVISQLGYLFLWH